MARVYFPLSIDAVEDDEGYQPGGFHPVHLGDVYDERYKIIHKLGSGGYSTTWLARDTVAARYVALKVVKASETANCVELRTQKRLSEIETSHPGRGHIRSLLAHFTLTGPNGQHQCLVSEVAGPTLPNLYDSRRDGYARRLRGEVAQKISKQVAQAIGFLHAHGIGHGDVTIPNILLKLKPIDEWTEEEIYERFGKPRTEELKPVSGSILGHSAPYYIVEAARVPEEEFLAEEIFLIDLGVSFPLDDPPRAQDIGVPLMYRAPETVFESRYDRYSDLWALACVLFEIRAGTPMFESIIGSEHEIIRQWVQMKGKMPEPWWTSWDARSSSFDEDGKPLPRGPNAVTWANEYPLSEMVADVGDDDEEADDEIAVEEDAYATPLERQPSLLELPGTRIAEEEATQLEDLLEKILQWRPEDRISVEQILEHKWFAY